MKTLEFRSVELRCAVWNSAVLQCGIPQCGIPQWAIPCLLLSSVLPWNSFPQRATFSIRAKTYAILQILRFCELICFVEIPNFHDLPMQFRASNQTEIL